MDFGYQQIAVRDAKGNKDRLTMLPTSAAEALKTQLATVKTLHLRDLADGFGGVQLPFALARKYPRADHEWARQYVFPAATRSRDPISGTIRRHHLGEWILQKSVKGVALANQGELARLTARPLTLLRSVYGWLIARPLHAIVWVSGVLVAVFVVLRIDRR
jgi:hypothetical protein